MKIPVIGVVDSNNSPREIDYVIPGNDDALRAVQFYTVAIADAILEGRASAGIISESTPVVEEEVIIEAKPSGSIDLGDDVVNK